MKLRNALIMGVMYGVVFSEAVCTQQDDRPPKEVRKTVY